MNAILDWLEGICQFFSTAWQYLTQPLFEIDLSWIGSLGVGLPSWLASPIEVNALALSSSVLIIALLFIFIVKAFIKWW